MSRVSPSSYARVLFTPDEDDYFMCRLCFVRRKQARGTGSTNLIEHLRRAHADSFDEEYHRLQQREGTLDSFFKVNEYALLVYHWIDWCVEENRELSMCEKPKTRKYTNLKPITTKTLKKYMFALEEVVQGRVRTQLRGQRIGLLVDAWTEAGTHFVAVIAVTPTVKVLLSFSTLEDEADMGADSMIELLDDILDTYAIDAGQLCFMVCDHASVNVAIAKKTNVPMIGCASHRLNLGVQAYLVPHEKLLEKLHKLMARLNTIKNRHHLREAGALMPVFRNATRWSSTFSMVHRYMQIREVLPMLERIDERLVDVMPSPRENMQLNALYEDMKNLESINKRLQTERDVSLSDARLLFEHVVEHYPATAKYLAPDASVVKFPDFENGVVKVLNGDQRHLTRLERAAVAKLLQPAPTPTVSAVAVAPVERESFADAALQRNAGRESAPPVDLRWIPATSNDVERLFSRSGIVFSSLRRAMSPTTLETLLYLRYNRVWWDASAVSQGIEKTKAKKKQRVE